MPELVIVPLSAIVEVVLPVVEPLASVKAATTVVVLPYMELLLTPPDPGAMIPAAEPGRPLDEDDALDEVAVADMDDELDIVAPPDKLNSPE